MPGMAKKLELQRLVNLGYGQLQLVAENKARRVEFRLMLSTGKRQLGLVHT